MASEYDDDENAETPIGVTSLRDYFAGCALHGMIVLFPKAGDYKKAAQNAYHYADAMMAAREGKG